MSDVTQRLLEGYVALDLTDLRGQFCGKCLTELGMDVVKIEPPQGDPVRRMGPFKGDQADPEMSFRFAYLNSGKRSVTLDLAKQEGQSLFLQLVKRADVVLESGDPGALDRQGIGFETLRQHNPRLILTSISGLGQSGPRSNFLAPDLVSFALGGLMYIAGAPENPPVNAPETQGYYFAGLQAALGTLLALWGRENSGRGEHVDISVQEGLATQEHLLRIFGSLGQNVERQGSQHPFAAPANIFPTKDGWVFLFVSRTHWKAFLKIWKEHPADFDNPKWEPDIVRRGAVDRVNQAVSDFSRQYSKEEFAQLMQENGIPCLPVNTPGEFAGDPQIIARELIQEVNHARLGSYRQIAFPVLLDGQRRPPSPPPLLGEHTTALLQEWLGLSHDEIVAHQGRGIV